MEKPIPHALQPKTTYRAALMSCFLALGHSVMTNHVMDVMYGSHSTATNIIAKIQAVSPSDTGVPVDTQANREVRHSVLIKSISGQVVSERSDKAGHRVYLAGAKICIKGTQTCVLSDSLGNYELKEIRVPYALAPIDGSCPQDSTDSVQHVQRRIVITVALSGWTLNFFQKSRYKKCVYEEDQRVQPIVNNSFGMYRIVSDSVGHR